MRQKKRGLIFVVSGPSGSGKTTLLKKLLEEKQLKKKIVKSISLTTRPKRSAEKNGKDYFFISSRRFQGLLAAKKILEWTRYLGYDYGTPKNFAQRHIHSGKHVILCLDLKGSRSVKKLYPQNTVTIFILPPSIEALRGRIAGRCHKTKKEEIRGRLKLAARELRAATRFDYQLVNQNLAQAVRGLKGIIIRQIDRVH